MKILINILFLLGAPLWALGQIPAEFAPVGAKWYYKIHTWATNGLGGQESCRPFIFECVKDTIVLQKNCKKIIERNRGYAKFVYAEGAKVYAWQASYSWLPQDSTFRLLYDFEALPGDTLHVNVEATCGYDCIINESWPFNGYIMGPSYPLIVQGYDSMAFGQTEVAVQYVADTCSSGAYAAGCQTLSDTIYKWIGGHSSLFTQSIFWGWDDNVCHRTDGLVYYYSPQTGWIHFSGEPKDTLPTPVSRPALSTASTVRVYPNPARDKMDIEHPFGSSVALFDATGRLVGLEKSFGERTELDVSLRPRGLYLLLVSDPSGAVFSQKVALE